MAKRFDHERVRAESARALSYRDPAARAAPIRALLDAAPPEPRKSLGAFARLVRTK